MKRGLILGWLLYVPFCILAQKAPHNIVQTNTLEKIAHQAKPNVYGLILGISQYASRSLDSLCYADSDAIHFQTCLNKVYKLKPHSQNFKVFLDKQAKYTDVIMALDIWLDSLKKIVHTGDILFIYWSGHGMLRNDDQKLFCSDAEYHGPGTEDLCGAINMQQLKDRVSAYAAKDGVRAYLIVDACRRNIIMGSQDGFVQEKMRHISYDGEFDFYATQFNGFSYESPNLTPGGGIFTYFFLLGLQGAADGNADNTVTARELRGFVDNVDGYVSKYIGDETRACSQIPEIAASANSWEVPMATLPPEMVRKYHRIGDSLLEALRVTSPASTQVHRNPPCFCTHVSGGYAYHHHFIYPLLPPQDTIPLNDTTYLNELTTRIKHNELITPAGASAYDTYQRLTNRFPKSRFKYPAMEKMASALLEKATDLIDRYLDGKLHYAPKDTFELAYQELSTALSVLPNDSSLRDAMRPKLIFLKARADAASFDPADWAEGKKLIDSGLACSHHAAYLYQTRGMLNSRMGRYLPAKHDFDTAMLYAPQWIYALYSSAANNFRIQEWESSINTCLKILQLDPNFSQAYSLRANNEESIQDDEQTPYYGLAIRLNQKAIEIDPATPSAYFNLGRLYEKMAGKRRGTDRDKNLVIAEYYYRTGGTRFDDDECLDRLGHLLFTERQIDSAEYYYKAALKINPYNPSTLVDYADMLGDPAQVDSLFLNALSSHDYNIGKRYCAYLFDIGSLIRSDSLFQELITQNDQDPTIFVEHSQQYEHKDSLLKARSILWWGMTSISESVWIAYNLAKLYYTHSTYRQFPHALDSADYYLNYARSLDPEYSLLTYAKSQVSALQKDVDSARHYYELADSVNKFVSSTNNFNAGLLTRADTLLAHKSYKEAIAAYDTIRRSLSPTDSGVIYRVLLRLTLAYYLNGQADAASGSISDALNYLTHLEDTIATNEYRGLIAFDKKDYRTATRLLSSAADDIDTDTARMEMALSRYKLQPKRRPVPPAVADYHQTIEEMKPEEGKIYSHFFITELTKFGAALDRLSDIHH